ARDTAGDVGTAITTPTEYDRASAYDVAAAAAKRLSEALRSLEEYGKLHDPAVARQIEQCRYAGYELERTLLDALRQRHPHQWTICVLLTAELCIHHDWQDVVAASLDAGADMVQLREKEFDDAELLRRARWLVEACRGRATVIINDRPDIAVLADADGVHVGQGDLDVTDARRIVGPDRLIGVSTSCLDDAHAAQRDGADYCGVGPMFSSQTKSKDHLAGLDYLHAYTAWNALPHLAISGITLETLPAIIDAGGRGVAVSQAICGAASPGEVVTTMREMLSASHRVIAESEA
ncbi:MAG: thiamine phosphate synthase, partial [Planctomycetota bacterium]